MCTHDGREKSRCYTRNSISWYKISCAKEREKRETIKTGQRQWLNDLRNEFIHLRRGSPLLTSLPYVNFLSALVSRNIHRFSLCHRPRVFCIITIYCHRARVSTLLSLYASPMRYLALLCTYSIDYSILVTYSVSISANFHSRYSCLSPISRLVLLHSIILVDHYAIDDVWILQDSRQTSIN